MILVTKKWPSILTSERLEIIKAMKKPWKQLNLKGFVCIVYTIGYKLKVKKYVILQSHNVKFISTQHPGSDTEVAFWNMIIENRCAVIVAFSESDETRKVNYCDI